MRVRTGQTKVRSFDHGLAQAPLNPRVDPPEKVDLNLQIPGHSRIWVASSSRRRYYQAVY
jgi:hypothetical protein